VDWNRRFRQASGDCRESASFRALLHAYPAERVWHRTCGSEGVNSAKQAPIVLAIFIVTQVLDGTLTYWGVSRFGVHIEFNSWLATLMTAIGPAPASVAL